MVHIEGDCLVGEELDDLYSSSRGGYLDNDDDFNTVVDIDNESDIVVNCKQCKNV